MPVWGWEGIGKGSQWGAGGSVDRKMSLSLAPRVLLQDTKLVSASGDTSCFPRPRPKSLCNQAYVDNSFYSSSMWPHPCNLQGSASGTSHYFPLTVHVLLRSHLL